MARPCSSAVPSRAGPLSRSRPTAWALASRVAWLASNCSKLRYPGCALGKNANHCSRGTLIMVFFPVAVAAGLAPLSVDERAGITGVVQGAQYPPVGQRLPGQLALARALAD